MKNSRERPVFVFLLGAACFGLPASDVPPVHQRIAVVRVQVHLPPLLRPVRSNGLMRQSPPRVPVLRQPVVPANQAQPISPTASPVPLPFRRRHIAVPGSMIA